MAEIVIGPDGVERDISNPITIFFFGRFGVGPEITCVAKQKFLRIMHDQHVNIADFMHYPHSWEIWHHTDRVGIGQWTMPTECYNKYWAPGIPNPDSCVALNLIGTLKRIAVIAIRNDGTKICLAAQSLLVSLGIQRADLAAIRDGTMSWPELKAKLDTRQYSKPKEFFTDAEIAADPELQAEL